MTRGARRVAPLLAALVLWGAGCAGEKYFRKVDLTRVNRALAPYDGFNLEANFFAVHLAKALAFGAGFEVIEMNMFYDLALGLYARFGAPAYGGSDGGQKLAWVPSGGLIYQPVISPILKPFIKVGAAGFVWQTDATGPNSEDATGVFTDVGPEVSIGIATAFHYRASVDVYLAKGMMPASPADPWIFALRFNVIGFSLVAFKEPTPGIHRLEMDDRIE